MRTNIYCDESCHLQHDGFPVMVLGAISCPEEKKREVFDDIRQIKIKHNLNSYFEIKWTKVSESKIDFYLEVIKYFWDSPDLCYRGLVATSKDRLDHDTYNNGEHDLWYYKMYYYLLDAIIFPQNSYKILIDKKDTHGGKRVQKLHEVLCNNQYDFKKEVIKAVCQIDSRESEILQLTDLINGAISYYYRFFSSNAMSNRGKRKIVEELLKHHNLSVMTGRCEQKFNLFIWTPRSTKEALHE